MFPTFTVTCQVCRQADGGVMTVTGIDRNTKPTPVHTDPDVCTRNLHHTLRQKQTGSQARNEAS